MRITVNPIHHVNKESKVITEGVRKKESEAVSTSRTMDYLAPHQNYDGDDDDDGLAVSSDPVPKKRDEFFLFELKWEASSLP
jgi:hypothetical protein